MNNGKANLNLMTILLIPIGIGINYVGGQIALLLKLPVYIDVIGTILVGALAGPLLGALTGLVTNLIIGITNPVYFPYAIVSVAIGLAAGFAAKKKWFTNWKGVIITAILIWAVALITSPPITVYVYGGATGDGAGLITSFLVATGKELWNAVFTSTIITETIDKFISVIVAFLIIKAIPDRNLLQFPLGKIYSKHQITTTTEEDWK